LRRNVGLGFQLARHGAKNKSELFLDRIEPRGGIASDCLEISHAIIDLFLLVG
jgi:hypothetical protein